MKFKYSAVKVQQTPQSKPFYVTSVCAEELLQWADVPRKKEKFLAGYQRDVIQPRITKISEFLTDASGLNIIPAAVIVALREDLLRASEVGGLSSVYELEITHEPFEPHAALEFVLKEFENRLSDEEKDSITLLEDESEGELEIPQEDAQDTEEIVEEAVEPQSYLAALTLQLRKSLESFSDLDPAARKAVQDYVSGVTKPGLILDGQHRVFGAKNVSEFPVYLPVVLIPGLPHSEQVFHFYVLNNKAVPLSKSQLRATISTSLGKGEIGRLFTRFKDTGVAAESAGWTYRMNTDSHSPFRGLINLGIQGMKTGVIPENVAYQLVSEFIRPKKLYEKQLFEKVAPWSADPGGDIRLKLFYSLWTAISEQYQNAWARGSANNASDPEGRQIFQKVSLLCLQRYLFDALNKEMPRRKKKGEIGPMEDLEGLAEDVKCQLTFLNENFFLKRWEKKGLDTSRGHELWTDNLTKAIANESKNLGNMQLFTP